MFDQTDPGSLELKGFGRFEGYSALWSKFLAEGISEHDGTASLTDFNLIFERPDGGEIRANVDRSWKHADGGRRLYALSRGPHRVKLVAALARAHMALVERGERSTNRLFAIAEASSDLDELLRSLAELS